AVLLLSSEMVIVNLNHETEFGEFGSEWLYAERPVEEKFCSIRQLRSGLLLPSHRSPNGSPAQDPRRNRRPYIARRWMKLEYLCRQSPDGRRKRLDSRRQHGDRTQAPPLIGCHE